MATTYLERTQGTPTDAEKFTLAMWIKLGTGFGADQLKLYASYGDSNNRGYMALDANDNLFFFDYSGGVSRINWHSTRVFRDPAAWYHIVVKGDSSQAVEADRFKIFINGIEETAWTKTATIGQSVDFGVCLASQADGLTIGTNESGSEVWDGLMAHVHYCDGYAYNASSFGEFDATSGIWVAKTGPSVTYGDNGYFLKFASGALGTDSSGEGNTFVVQGTMTNTKDTPDNNFATMNPLDNYYPNQTFTNGNLTIKSDYKACPKATIGLTSGKWYWEGKAAVATATTDWTIGISSTQQIDTSSQLGYRANDWSYYGSDGDYLNNNTDTSYGDSYTTLDIIGVALDLTNNKLYFSKNGVWQNSGVPTSGGTGTGAISITAVGSTPLREYFPSSGAFATANDYTWSMNFGNGYFGTTVAGTETDDAGIGLFKYDVPAGYYAICTTNLGDQS